MMSHEEMRLRHCNALIGKIQERLTDSRYTPPLLVDYNLLLEAKNLLEEYHITEEV